MLTIRKGVPTDLAEIWLLVEDAIIDMNQKGNPQWGKDYPSLSHFAEGIAAGELYAACDEAGKILGVAILNTDQEPVYEDLSGWRETPPAMLIHKVAVLPSAQRMGVASALFAHAFALARKDGLRSIRMDTYCMNGRMQGLVRKHGFHYVGNVHFPNRPLAYRVYEKLL